jgi:hypothetical protein
MAHLEGQLPVLDLLDVAADRGVRDDVLAQVQLVQHRRLPGIVQPCGAVRTAPVRRAQAEDILTCTPPSSAAKTEQ